MDESKNMFWGLAVKPNKRYETEVQEAFRITKVRGYRIEMVFVNKNKIDSKACWEMNLTIQLLK